MKDNILYLEGDWMWRELVEPQLRKYGPVISVDNEHDFRETVDDMASKNERPSVAVLEQRVKWAHPAPKMPECPAEVKAEGYCNAGVRCFDYLRRKLGKIPTIFYSNEVPGTIFWVLLERGIKDEPTVYLDVEKRETSEELHAALRKIMQVN